MLVCFSAMMLCWVLVPMSLMTVQAATAEEWASRSIYQLITDRFATSDGSYPVCNIGERKYCGGTWQGIRQKLDYIRGMGFDAIWISPIVQNFDQLSQYGQAYHGYWTQNINELNSHYGSSTDLENLVKAVHDADMYIMVDVTINSMAWPGSHEKIDYSSFSSPFNTAAAYHPFCWVDWANATSVLECWIGDDNVALLDVKTQEATIRSTYQAWIQNLIREYQFDGVRIDALKSIEPEFFPDFLTAANVFAIGENFQENPAMCCAYQSSVPGLLNFPTYWGLFYAFNATAGGMQNLVNLIDSTRGNCSIHLMGNFLENHDLRRYAGITSDQHQRINALAFTFVNDGIPIVYYGQEQAFTGQIDPYNREALWISDYDTRNPYYTTIASLNAVRKNAIATDTSSFVLRQTDVLTHGTDHLVLKKGDLLSILFNDGVWGSNDTISIANSGYPANTALIEIMSHNITWTDGQGSLSLPRHSGAPMIFWPYSKWNKAAPRPNTDVEINIHTTATTTMTTTYIYPTAREASSASSRFAKGSSNIRPLALVLSLGIMMCTVLVML